MNESITYTLPNEFLETMLLATLSEHYMNDGEINWKDKIKTNKDAAQVSIFTANHEYKIVCKNSKERDNENHSYLGCVMSNRFPNDGEDWTRGRDFPDGSMSLKTWTEIIQAILSHEIVH